MLVLYVAPALLVGPDEDLSTAEELKAENDVRTTLLQALVGLALLTGAYFTGRTYFSNRENTMRQFELDRQGQVTERFTKAIDQLGSKTLDVRLGGIYALERIAQESERDHWPIVEVLTAFVRERAPWTESDGEERGQLDSEMRKPNTDVQAVLTVLGRRTRSSESDDQRLDLVGTDLRGANLRGSHLERANLSETHLEGADLDEAHLDGAIFGGAHLVGAQLGGAHLKSASLGGAYLDGAVLEEADLQGAFLVMAHLDDAVLQEAHLEGADLGGASLDGADLIGAYLEGADLGDAKLYGADLREAYVGSAKLQGTHFHGADLSGAHLECANLEDATGLTREQLAEALTDESTKLPPDVR